MPQPVVASFRVRPRTSPDLPRPDPVKIHTLDLIVPLVWTPIYYFFPPVSQVDYPVKETVPNLITSLIDVLEHFPLLAGTIKPDGSEGHKIHSDNVGADFIYELRNEKFPGVHVDGLDPRGLDFGIPAPGEPLVAIKFTAVCPPVFVFSEVSLTFLP